MEKKASNAVEMAAQKNEKREKIEKTAQGWIKIVISKVHLKLIKV